LRRRSIQSLSRVSACGQKSRGCFLLRCARVRLLKLAAPGPVKLSLAAPLTNASGRTNEAAKFLPDSGSRASTPVVTEAAEGSLRGVEPLQNQQAPAARQHPAP